MPSLSASVPIPTPPIGMLFTPRMLTPGEDASANASCSNAAAAAVVGVPEGEGEEGEWMVCSGGSGGSGDGGASGASGSSDLRPPLRSSCSTPSCECTRRCRATAACVCIESVVWWRDRAAGDVVVMAPAWLQCVVVGWSPCCAASKMLSSAAKNCVTNGLGLGFRAKVRVEGCTTDARWARGGVLYVHSEFRARSSTFRS